MCHESFKDVSRVFRDFQGCFQSVSRKFQENFQDASKKFHVAWHSSQLPEQKEGLFFFGVLRCFWVFSGVFFGVLGCFGGYFWVFFSIFGYCEEFWG